MPKKKPHTIFIVSDGRGETCSQLVRAALVQFEDQQYEMIVEGEVRTTERVERIVRSAVEENALIFYTLVSDDTRNTIKACAHQRLVPVVDVLGPAFSALNDLFHSERAARPGRLYELDRDHFDRVTAIDYTLKHDDGQRVRDLDQADVVLVGVSRASKSSTCFYLAYEGIRCANVPLFPDIPPPDELLRLAPERVVGLRINTMRLRTVREARAENFAAHGMDEYLDKRQIAMEVREAHRLMERQGWRTVDVSYKAIEEIARQVMRLLGYTPRSDGGGS